MGTGIKMRSARDGHGNTRALEALQALSDADHAIPPLYCMDLSCGCAVRFVPRHQKKHPKRVEPIDVPAYIGLSSGSEHVTGCSFDAKKRLAAIADDSDPDFLKALKDGKRELRMLALHEALKAPGLSGNAPASGPPKAVPAGGGTTTEVTSSGRRIDSYLRTTSDLVVLRAMCESDALLASELTIQFHGKHISWHQFFFDEERLDDAWDAISRHGKASYPVAIAATVRHLNHPKPGATHTNSFLNCVSLTRKTLDPDRLEVFEVSMAHKDRAWLSSFPAGTAVAAFGFWHVAAPTERKVPHRYAKHRTLTFVTHKLTLFIRFKKQLAAIP